jgi:hypothetical protein
MPRIYIWGTGRLVGKVVGRWIEPEQIVAFVDNDTSKKEYMGKSVISPQELINKEYDAVVVANLYSKEIKEQCVNLGIDTSKCIYLYGNCELQDMNMDYTFVSKILGGYSEVVRERYHVVRGVESTAQRIAYDGYYKTDYVRIKIFEMVVKEINKRNFKTGSVAEVGVFRGEFAQFINKAFPDRLCYLFDTFEGFDNKEAIKEVNAGNATESFVEAYKNTSLQCVLDKMTNLSNIRIKQGYFPESLDGLEEQWVFVSIDVDFENSIYAALEYFYPRLVKGGYIFVHDYSSDLRGVEKAVDDYEKNYSVTLAKVPLCDANGTLVITK